MRERSKRVNYKKVESSQTERPIEIDRISSPNVVYLRKNIKKIQRAESKEDDSLLPVELWEYEECELPVDVYEEMQRSLELLSTQTIMQNLSEVDMKVELLSLGMESQISVMSFDQEEEQQHSEMFEILGEKYKMNFIKISTLKGYVKINMLNSNRGITKDEFYEITGTAYVA